MKISRNWFGLSSVLMLVAFGAGLGLRPLLFRGCQPGEPPPGTIRAKEGPWGVLDYTPISIAAPDELLPVRTLEGLPLHWYFGGMKPADVSRALIGLGMTAEDCHQLLTPANMKELPGGTMVAPANSPVQALAPALRSSIYRLLAQFIENRDDYLFVQSRKVLEHLRSCDVSPATLATAQNWSCTYGNYTMFYALPCLLGTIPDHAEKIRLMKALSLQDTYLLRMQLTPQTDINELKKYWGKACWSLDVSSFLRSLAAVPEGTWLDVIELLPPFPSSMIYSYPLPQNPLNGPLQHHDCHWTSFNFFRDPPDERYSNPNYVLQKLKNDYYLVSSDPRYGDVVLFTKPDGSSIHSAVFLADNFVYSKNGDTVLHPWLISTIPDLLAYYSFLVPPDQRLTVQFFRNKYY